MQEYVSMTTLVVARTMFTRHRIIGSKLVGRGLQSTLSSSESDCLKPVSEKHRQLKPVNAQILGVDKTVPTTQMIANGKQI